MIKKIPNKVKYNSVRGQFQSVDKVGPLSSFKKELKETTLFTDILKNFKKPVAQRVSATAADLEQIKKNVHSMTTDVAIHIKDLEEIKERRRRSDLLEQQYQQLNKPRELDPDVSKGLGSIINQPKGFINAKKSKDPFKT